MHAAHLCRGGACMPRPHPLDMLDHWVQPLIPSRCRGMLYYSALMQGQAAVEETASKLALGAFTITAKDTVVSPPLIRYFVDANGIYDYDPAQ